MKKTYILDTNVLLTDPNALFSFENNDLILPLIVIEELDRHKDRQDEVGRNARETTRKLSLLTKENIDIKAGIPLGVGLGALQILSVRDAGQDSTWSIPSELEEEKTGDNIIAAFCLAYSAGHPDVTTTMVTRDVLLQLKCKALGIPCQDYQKYNVATSATHLYLGVKSLTGVDVDQFYSSGQLVEYSPTPNLAFHPNEFAVLKESDSELTGGKSAMVKWKESNNGNGSFIRVAEYSPSKITPRNKEQKFAIDLLMDDSIKLVTIVGNAGCGKTLCAIAAGIEQVIGNFKRYKSLVVCRPIQPMGKDIGYLPGTLEEKMEPWIAPIKDNLRFLLSEDGKKSKSCEETMSILFERGTIEVEALTFIRGRSIANAFMIIDEAQNLSAHELKTIITRAGENTKIVLTGDISQIDNMYVDSVSNGLSVAVERFKDQKIAGHVTLLKGERSELATIASQIL